MNLNELQQKLASTVRYNNLVYPYLALSHDVGFIMGNLAMPMTGKGSPAGAQASVRAVLPSVLSNVVEICSQNGWDLQEIADAAIQIGECRREQPVPDHS
jgi:hypothetical protein